MARFLCWTLDYDETEFSARSVTADAPEQAAERYAADRDWSGCEFPAESEVQVRDESGAEFTFAVRMETMPVYHAITVKPARLCVGCGRKLVGEAANDRRYRYCSQDCRIDYDKDGRPEKRKP